jgi:hypothetical protein
MEQGPKEKDLKLEDNSEIVMEQETKIAQEEAKVEEQVVEEIEETNKYSKLL